MAQEQLRARFERTFKMKLPQLVVRKNMGSMTRFANRFAAILRQGDVVALSGNLGSGKTWLVGRICDALNVHQQGLYITSPTYTVANVYDTEPAIAHLDIYRLFDADDFYALGGEEYISNEYVTFIEWADRMPDIIPADALWLHLEADGVQRKIQCK